MSAATHDSQSASQREESIRRLVVVSNRLPIVLVPEEGGGYRVEPGSGGLVTALAPVLRDRGGMWLGWPGAQIEGDIDEQLASGAERTGYSLKPVVLTKEEIDLYYYGFSNEVLWPLFHDLFTKANFKPEYWRAYQAVNRKFAERIALTTKKDDFVWVHDYHLMLVAHYLREMGVDRKIGFFLHIPFPPQDIFVKLPWRRELLGGLAAYDLLGFQTIRDRRNFTQCVRSLVKGAKVRRQDGLSVAVFADHEVRFSHFEISIDYAEFSRGASQEQVEKEAWYIHENFPEQQLILGVDRLDYTKGIPLRLEAYRTFLQHYPEWHGKVKLVQQVVPSRRDLEEYESLKQEIERQVGEINGEYNRPGWTPIHYFFRSVPRWQLLAYYRTCELALITPLKDGMNLVAKEFCAASVDEHGVLILSEFAGAAARFHKDAILVNPYDIEGVAEAIHRALMMPVEERKARMRRMRRQVQRQDIFRWVDSFLKAAIHMQLDTFPQHEEGAIAQFEI